MKAWHFLKDDGRLRYRDGIEVEDGEIVEVGKTYTAIGEIKLCANGMHGSKRILDALRYAEGSILCEVEIDGEIVEGDDKLAGRNRTVISIKNVSAILHEFACLCAEKALTIAKVDDKRSWEAIAAKRAWLKGEIDDGQLDAARDAAWAAAWDAAWAAAWEAARDAAWDAARDEQNTLLAEMVNSMGSKNVHD